MDSHQQPCPQCGQDSFDYEDTPIGLVCTCGYVVDDSILVHQQTYDFDGTAHAGVHVAAEDDGTLAGAIVLADGGLVSNRVRGAGSSILPSNKIRLQQGVTALNLPRYLEVAANDLLAKVVKLYADAEQRKGITAATVAAIIYLVARERQHALTLGRAGWALSVPGAAVAKEFRHLTSVLLEVGYLDEVPPASLEAHVRYTAARVLQHFLQGHDESSRLWRHPIVQNALEVAELLKVIDATDGQKPEVTAAAVLALCLSEHFRDGRPAAYALQVCKLTGLNRKAVQSQVHHHQEQLAPLIRLLPFSSGQSTAAGLEAVRNAGTLLKLRHLLHVASKEGGKQQPQQSDVQAQQQEAGSQ